MPHRKRPIQIAPVTLMTTSAAAKRKLMTAGELFMLPRGVKRRELIRGASVEYPFTENLGGQAASRISAAIGNWADIYDCGHAVMSCGFWLDKDPDTVRACHIARVAGNEVANGYPEAAPELAVEIKQPHHSAPEIAAKAYMWLSYGSRQAWVADPPAASITIYRLGAAPVTLGEDDILDGGELLPGFSVPVWQLFRRRR